MHIYIDNKIEYQYYQLKLKSAKREDSALPPQRYLTGGKRDE